MLDNHEQYEIECERIRESNKELLASFRNWLVELNLNEKTINRHIRNIDFYINQYLLYEDAVEPQEGLYSVNMFLGYWFIRKAMWATVSSIKSNAASLKKFYAFLHKRGLVSKDGLNFINKTIKERMPEWLATLARYDDPSITDMAEVWRL